METKICSMCSLPKPLDEFPKHSVASYSAVGRKNLPTHENRCRPCKAQTAREWRKAHPGYDGTGAFKNIPKADRLLHSAISQRLTQARTRTAMYGHPAMDIDKEYLHQLFLGQGGRCALSGVPLKVEKRAVTCLSLDQKEAALGYVKGNVQWVAWAVNRAKGDMQHDVFIDMCRQVLEYQKVQRLSPSGSTPKRVEAQNPSTKLGEDIV